MPRSNQTLPSPPSLVPSINETAEIMKSLQREVADLKHELKIFKHTTINLLQQVNTSVLRLSLVPVPESRTRGATEDLAREEEVVANVGGSGGGGAPVLVEPVQTGVPSVFSTLSKCPKTLYVLWREWEFGIGGRKPAKSFNRTERGRVKHKYSLRKVFWDMVCKLVRDGYSSNTAIEKIYSVYSPRLSVTGILRMMRKDKRTGGHPLLT